MIPHQMISAYGLRLRAWLTAYGSRLKAYAYGLRLMLAYSKAV